MLQHTGKKQSGDVAKKLFYSQELLQVFVCSLKRIIVNIL